MGNTLQKFFDSFYSSTENLFIAFTKNIPHLIIAVFIFSIGLILSNQLTKIARKAFSLRTHDKITIKFLSKIVKILLMAFFIMYALKIGGLQGIASGILTAAGASAVIIGFAFRDIGENFISGIILSFNRPFNVGDTVSIGEIFGKINTIEFRYVKLRTFDGKDVYIPNSDVIKKPVFNFTEDGLIRFDFMVGIAYEDDIDEVCLVITNVLKSHESIFSDENHEYFVCVDELTTNTVTLKVHFWIKTYEYGMLALKIRGSVIASIKHALMDAGHNLPANIIELKMYDNKPFTLKRSQEFSKHN